MPIKGNNPLSDNQPLPMPFQPIAYGLPKEVDDIVTLWIRCQFEGRRFTTELQRIQADPQAIIQQHLGPPQPQRQLSPDEVFDILKVRAVIDWDAAYAEWVRDEVLNKCVPVISGEGNIEQWVCPSPSHLEEKAYFRISYDNDTDFGIPQCSCNIQDEPEQWEKVGEWVGANGFVEWLHDRLFKKWTQTSNLMQEPTSDQSLTLVHQQPAFN